MHDASSVLVHEEVTPARTAAGRVLGHGEMADNTRAFDWSTTSVGAMDQWPEALLIAVNLLLANRYPMFLWWGPDLIQFYNDAYRPSLGRDKHPTALGQCAQQCWPEIWEAIRPQIDAVMLRGESSWHENQLLPIYRNGRLEDVYWTYSYSPVRDGTGAIRGTLVTCNETTERVLAERQVHQVLEATTDAVLGLDRDWCFNYLNEHAKRILASSGELLGKNLWEEFPGTVFQDSPYKSHYHRAMYDRLGGEFEAFYPEPLNRWFLIFTRPSPDGVIIFFRDITEVKRAMSALIQNEKLAAVGRLTASIAHEINNPLESVTNLLYLARLESSNAAEIQEYLQTADRELRRVSAISNQTLRFHRQSTSPLPVTFSSLLESVLSIYQGRLVNAGVHVKTEERSSQPILCFEGEIRQVLSNLLVNGIDAMPEGGRLLLRSHEATHPATGERGLVITVADTGIGMAPQTVRRIFEPFYTTKGNSGTGLGLWVSQEIVRRHGGTLRVRSSQRQGCSGTVFRLFLPFAAVERSE